MRLTLLFCLAISSALGQSVQITVSNVHPDSVKLTVIPPKPKEKVYVQPPNAPVFSNPNTITLSGNQTVFASNLNGKLEQILTGTATNLTLNGIGGTASMPVVFSGGVIKGTSATQRSIRTLNASRYFEMHGFVADGNDGGVMLSGPTDGSSAGINLVNGLINGPKFAGYWCNTGGGSYEYINSSFLRVKNSGGEGLYLGNTSKATRSTIKQSKHQHLFIQNAGWDALQITSASNLSIDRFTIIGAGKLNQAGQNALIQLQMCNGIVENGIAIGGASSLSLFSHDLTIRNCYFSWDSEDAIYIGDASGEPQLNGKPLTIDGCTFVAPGSKPLAVVAMRGADVVIKNCVISDNRRGLFTDSRGTGSGNRLVDGGGNVFLPAAQIEKPEFKDDGAVGMVVVNDSFYNAHRGFRTP